jgi:hypothetical protein
MANVLNRTTNEYLLSVNTPDYDPASWIINPDLSAVLGVPSAYWVITGDVVTLASNALRNVIDDNAFIALINSQSTTSEVFGDGSDGPSVISVDTVLTQDIYPTILTVNQGVKITWNGFKIFAQYGVINRGIISLDGADATSGGPGLGSPSNTLGGGGDGAAGTTGAGANASNLITSAAPGFGGGGGNGGAGTAGTGGQGGNTRLGAATTRLRPLRLLPMLFGGDFDALNGFVQFRGGAGGGAGAGDGANLGGSGGGGAGFGTIASPFIFNGPTGIISARGGAGFTPTAGNCGGGGGGAGGVLNAVRLQIRNRGTFDVSGGAPGLAFGSGVAGQAGKNGRMKSILVSIS